MDPEPNSLVNDDVAHPFSSPETVNRLLNDFPGVLDTSLYQSAQSDIDENENQENVLPNLFDLNEKLKYLQMECERAQRITTHFEK
jgi:hypothetical protein